MSCLQAALCTFTRALPLRFAASQRLFSDRTIIDPPDDDVFDIPKPKQRENEPLNIQKARLLYQSRKRGMLENDLLLSTFAAKYLHSFSQSETQVYDNLINGPSNDWEIYYWATNKKSVPPQYDSEVMRMLKQHCRNINKEQRIRQPDLTT